MRMSLRRIREIQDIKLKDLASACNMDVERLRAIEHYRELPTWYEIIRILKCCKHYFDEVVPIVWHDIEDHYIPKDYNEYSKIQSSLKCDDLPIETIEQIFILNKEGDSTDE